MKKKRIFLFIILIMLMFSRNLSFGYNIEEGNDIRISSAQSVDDIMKDADKFIEEADTSNTIDQAKLQTNVKMIYNIFLACGLVVAVACGVAIGIKFMAGSAESKAETKEVLVPYVVGCVIIFGAFGIWKVIMVMMERFA